MKIQEDGPAGSTITCCVALVTACMYEYATIYLDFPAVGWGLCLLLPLLLCARHTCLRCLWTHGLRRRADHLATPLERRTGGPVHIKGEILFFSLDCCADCSATRPSLGVCACCEMW